MQVSLRCIAPCETKSGYCVYVAVLRRIYARSEFRSPDRGSDEAQLALLEPETRELIADTEKLHQRIARLDDTWRQHLAAPSPARAFQDRIGRELGRLG